MRIHIMSLSSHVVERSKNKSMSSCQRYKQKRYSKFSRKRKLSKRESKQSISQKHRCKSKRSKSQREKENQKSRRKSQKKKREALVGFKKEIQNAKTGFQFMALYHQVESNLTQNLSKMSWNMFQRDKILSKSLLSYLVYLIKSKQTMQSSKLV